MKFIETRGNDGQRAPSVSFSEAILDPMCSFGGIYAPEHLPDLGLDFLSKHLADDYKQLAKSVLDAFDIDIEYTVIDEALDTYERFDDADNPDDRVFDKDGVSTVIDEASLDILDGSTIDYVEDLIGSAFRISSANFTASCGCGASFAI